MVSFYPGPSQVHEAVSTYMQDAFHNGILGINHRSPEFVSICKRAITAMKNKLAIPEDYTVFFTGSATECWEIIAQSLITDGSFHWHNGAFGERWFQNTRYINPKAKSIAFDPESEPVFTDIATPRDALLAITQNETSNATQVGMDQLRILRKACPDALIAVDATSSMGGIALDFSLGDVWLASVQKCFGLPAGMGIMVCSPASLSRARAIQKDGYYNSLTAMADRMEDWQTTYTPNVLNIYLLMRVMEMAPEIHKTHARLEGQSQSWQRLVDQTRAFSWLIENKNVRSTTVMALKGRPEDLSKIKKLALEKGYLLGNGYGKWKNDTFRIANFPAHQEKDIKQLQELIGNYK